MRRPTAPVWTNGPVSPSFASFLRDIAARLPLVPALVRYTRVATFAHMRLGMLWLVVRPLFLIAATTIVAVSVLHPGDDPTAIHSTLLGIGLWYSFHRGVMHLGRAPVRLRRIARDYTAIPRVIFVLAGFGAASVEIAIIGGIALLGYGALALRDGQPLVADPALLWLLPVSLLVMAAFALAFSLVVSHLVDLARDVWYLFKYLLSGLLVATPIVYPVSALPGWAADWIWINPFTGAVSAFRNAFLGGPVDWLAIGYAAIVALAVFVAAIVVSYRFERPPVRLFSREANR